MAQRHAYSSVARDQSQWEGQLAILAIVVAVAVSFGIDAAFDQADLDVPWLVSTPSALGVWALLRKVYREHLWRWRLGPFRMVGVPHVGGTWVGIVMIDDPGEATFVDFPAGEPQLCTATVAQSLHEMCVQFYTAASESSSLTATLDTDDGTGAARMEYSYHAKPRYLSNRSFVEHDGIAKLTEVRPPPSAGATVTRRLQGNYYTSSPQHTGVVDVTFLGEERRALDELDLAKVPEVIRERYAAAIAAYLESRDQGDRLVNAERETPRRRRHRPEASS